MTLVYFDSGLLCDADSVFDAVTAQTLASTSYQAEPDGPFVKFEGVFRYVGLHGPAPGDITIAERDILLRQKLLLGLVQHCRRPETGLNGWMASGARGKADGQVAAACAQAVGYDAVAHLALDLEDVANAGPPVSDHCNAWSEAVMRAGFSPLLYVGYQCGLTPDELWALPLVHAYWSDAGARAVATRGFVLRQRAQILFPGLPFAIDPDLAAPDHLGGTLRLMGP